MESNPQDYLALTLKNDTCTIEFIKHQDLHYWIYFNGVMTDAMFPRHLNFNTYMKPYQIYDNLWFGKSKYNEKKVKKFFMNLIPEHFL